MPKGLRKVRISVEDASLTHYGGMVLFQQFCRKLDLRRYLQNYISWDRRSSHYHPADLILTMIYTMVAGMKRISDTRILRYNGYFQSLLGLKEFPGQSTLREFLLSLNDQEVESLWRLHDTLRKVIYQVTGIPNSLIWDVDSTILSLFGFTIQEAKVGYNPQKMGRPSYHPLLCFEGRSRSCWHGVLRPGNAASSTGIQIFFQECLKKLPAYLYRIRLRADGGFYNHVFSASLDEQKIGFVIVAKLTRPLRERIQALRYRSFRADGWQAASFLYQPQNFPKPYRFVAVRRPDHNAQKHKQQQPTLWKNKHYFYHVYITNLNLSAPGVWHFYKRRARAELDIKELKESFPLGKIPTRNFLANKAHFYLILLAYDLIQWFKLLCLPPKWQTATLQTLRTELLVVPARLVYSGGVNHLRLPIGYIHRKTFRTILKTIDKLKIRKKR